MSSIPSADPDLPPRRLPAQVFALGFTLNKRLNLRRFAGESRVRFVGNPKKIPAGASLLLWGSTPPPPGLAPDVQIIRVEDGFLRSVGLGAELTRPISWVMDRRGIYYDATRPSDLEHLLQTFAPSAQLLARARRLRERIVTSGVTKYSVGAGAWRRPPGARRVILVPGQVETDASLRFGAPAIRTNLALLQAARQRNPDAFIVYKPHPDVVAGLRARGAREDEAPAFCDEQLHDVAMGELLMQVDEVHVLTSLAGFEALLRQRPVVCYGRPFYSGWGLTQDLCAPERRTRQLALDELVAGALLAYPSYVSRRTGRLMCAEEALEELLNWRESTPAATPAWRHLWRALLRCTVGCR